MNILYVFLLGAVTGIVLSIISMLIISASNSEKYPVGGMIPALWMIKDFAIPSQVIVAGILIMGGMTGFYLALTFWKERPEILRSNNTGNEHSPISSKTESSNKNSTITVKGKSLAQFL